MNKSSDDNDIEACGVGNVIRLKGSKKNAMDSPTKDAPHASTSSKPPLKKKPYWYMGVLMPNPYIKPPYMNMSSDSDDAPGGQFTRKKLS